MKLSEPLRESIADQITLAANGVDPRACFHRIIALIESAPVTLDALPMTPAQEILRRAELPQLPEDLRAA